MRSLMAMLRRTGPDAACLYTALVDEARRPGWFTSGALPDTIDGRFAVLSSLVALAVLRLERGGEEAVRHSVALTEAFIADMDVQMRELGFSDASLGKQVRHMVGSLAARLDRWRVADEAGLDQTGPDDWEAAVAANFFGGERPGEAAFLYALEATKRLRERLDDADDRALVAGRISR